MTSAKPVSETGSSSALLLGLFFLSGCSALIYETLWQRMMILVFGASAPATTAILTAFFCGIGFGSYFGGRLLKRFRNTLAAYGWLELWTGSWGLAVPSMLAATDQIYLLLFHGSEPDLFISVAIRFVLCIAVVLPATLGMGATIPAMNRLLVERGRGVGHGVAAAYGYNTIGAMLGCLAAGFVLIRELGVQNSLYLAAAVNALVVAIAFVASRYRGNSAAAGTEAGKPRIAAEAYARPRALVAIYFCTGALALGYEILWFRILAIYATNSIVTFTLILSTYLLGFSAGSILLYPLLARRLHGLTLLAVSNLGAAFSVLLTLPLVYSFPAMQEVLHRPASREALTPLRLAGVETCFALVMILLPTLFMGLAYPALCQVLVPSKESTAERTGLYYFVGTIGAVVGVILVGFVVIPGFGLVGSVGTLCFASCLLAFLTLKVGRATPVRGRFVLVTCCTLLAGASVIYGYNGHPFLKTANVDLQEGRWVVRKPRGDGRIKTLLRYAAGHSGTVIVKGISEPGSNITTEAHIYVDDQAVAASTLNNRIDSKMLAHLPLLLHPDPERALTVGFGSGGTSWSMTLHGVETDCVEIEAEVPRSAFLFRDQNRDVLNHPGFRLILNDARDHLHITDRQYDVISTDATNLQYKQNGNLYSREYFRLIKSRLSAGGIACTWTPMVKISEPEFKILLKTWADVFEHPSLWFMNHSLSSWSIFVATPGPLTIDLNRVREGFADSGIRADLSDILVEHPFQFANFLLLDEDGIRSYVGDVPVHTDDRPLLEFFSAFEFYQRNHLRENNLLDALPFRPGNVRRLARNLDGQDAELFDKYTRAGQLWTEVLARFMSYGYMRYDTTEPAADKLKKVEGALQTGMQALDLLPANRALRDIMQRLSKVRQTLLGEARQRRET